MSEAGQSEEKAEKPAAKPKVTKKPTVKKDGKAGKKGAGPVIKKKPAKKVTVKAKALTKKTSVKPAKASKRATKAVAPKDKKAKKVKGSSPTYSKFEQFAIDAINVNASEASPYVSFAKIKQYAIDYVEKSKLGSIPKLVKKALLSLEVKKILKAKKDSYAFAAAGKGLAGKKVPDRKKVIRETKKAAKPAEAGVTIAKPVVTTSGRTSRPVAAT
jgi:hypothetical protein